MYVCLYMYVCVCLCVYMCVIMRVRIHTYTYALSRKYILYMVHGQNVASQSGVCQNVAFRISKMRMPLVKMLPY